MELTCPIVPIKVTKPMERLHIDFKGPICHPSAKNENGEPTSQGFVYILHVVDHFTKFLWTKVTDTKESGQVVKYLRKLFLREGTPHILQSDNGKEFVNECIDSMFFI